jgi:methylglutaconyl-CoA hydratase
MTGAVSYGLAAGVATLTMDDPDTPNALTAALLDGLGDALHEAIADASVRVIVLTHAGSTFCAGADLRAGARRDADPPRHDLPAVLSAILDSPKPVVARIAGHCMGGGVGLAAACDLSFASRDVLFGFTEVRIGVAPAIISVVVLPKLRRGDALELFLTGERVSALRAAEAGLISSAVAAGDLDGTVEAAVDKLIAGSPSALAAAKRLVYEVPPLERGEAFRRTAEISAELFAGEEAAEGMSAFREKRLPSWRRT